MLISGWPACSQLQKKPKKLQFVSLTHFLHPDKGLFPPSKGDFLQNNEVLKDNCLITDCPDRSHPQTFQIYIDIIMTKVNLFCIVGPSSHVCVSTLCEHVVCCVLTHVHTSAHMLAYIPTHLPAKDQCDLFFTLLY